MCVCVKGGKEEMEIHEHFIPPWLHCLKTPIVAYGLKHSKFKKI